MPFDRSYSTSELTLSFLGFVQAKTYKKEGVAQPRFTYLGNIHSTIKSAEDKLIAVLLHDNKLNRSVAYFMPCSDREHLCNQEKLTDTLHSLDTVVFRPNEGVKQETVASAWKRCTHWIIPLTRVHHWITLNIEKVGNNIQPTYYNSRTQTMAYLQAPVYGRETPLLDKILTNNQDKIKQHFGSGQLLATQRRHLAVQAAWDVTNCGPYQLRVQRQLVTHEQANVVLKPLSQLARLFDEINYKEALTHSDLSVVGQQLGLGWDFNGNNVFEAIFSDMRGYLNRLLNEILAYITEYPSDRNNFSTQSRQAQYTFLNNEKTYQTAKEIKGLLKNLEIEVSSSDKEWTHPGFPKAIKAISTSLLSVLSKLPQEMNNNRVNTLRT